MSKSNRYSPEIRERAVRLVFDHEHDHPSQWAAIRSRTCSTRAPRARPSPRASGDEPHTEGLTVTDDKAHAAGFVVVGALYDGYHTTPDPLPPEEELWLAEHGLAYARFEPEKPGTGRILRGSYEPAGGGTPVWGTLVYER